MSQAIRRKPKPNSPPPAKLPETGYVRIPLLMLLLPFSQATLWRMVKRKAFPSPVKLSTNITAWRVEDVRAWLDEKREPQEPQGQAA